ncbi:hypothetical protein COLO4_12960 [Corchorus olitorius]|uniref:Uncharacterized protein n=1 Tax=Corchorus olitorius TaxID=93759 RepID=A0A1R3JZ12_9ROSI|nr:hypothetical protein COLO4_12960 [Corchorus olitorius]
MAHWANDTGDSSERSPRAHLHEQIQELKAGLAYTNARYDEMRAHNETFKSNLVDALRLKGIDLSELLPPSIAVVPPALTEESGSHVDEHSPVSADYLSDA